MSVENWLTGLRPYTWLTGPHIIGDTPVNTRYSALAMLMMVPVEWYVAATSGVAARTVVLDMGERKAHNESRQTIMSLR